MSEHEDPFFARLQRIWQSGPALLPPRVNEEFIRELSAERLVDGRWEKETATMGSRRQGKTLQQAREAKQALAEGKTVYIPRRGPFGQIDGLQRVVDVVLPEDEG